MIPLGGMKFSNCINSISLAIEIFFEEVKRSSNILDARNASFRTIIIPATNALFSVCLVSLSGKMTGQILSGIDTLKAMRYRIMVMAMTYGAEGLSSAVFLYPVYKASFRLVDK